MGKEISFLYDLQTGCDTNTKFNQQPEIRNSKSRYKEMEEIYKKVEWGQNSLHLFIKHTYRDKGVEIWCCWTSRPMLQPFRSAVLTAHLKACLYSLNQYSGSCFDNLTLVVFLLEGWTKGRGQSSQQGPSPQRFPRQKEIETSDTNCWDWHHTTAPGQGTLGDWVSERMHVARQTI